MQTATAQRDFWELEEQAIIGSMLGTGRPVVDIYITELGTMLGSYIADKIGDAITLRQNLAAFDFTGDIGEGDLRPIAEVAVNETQDFLSDLEDSLLAALDFETGWDGYDGMAPTQDAVDDALSFVRHLPADTTPPRPLIASDGEVGVYWKDGRAYVEVGFYGDGNITYFARDKDGNVVTSNERPYSRDFVPRDLYEAIEQFSGLP